MARVIQIVNIKRYKALALSCVEELEGAETQRRSAIRALRDIAEAATQAADALRDDERLERGR